MVTFTLPYELRALAWHNQTAVYTILFDCAASTLKDFGLNPANLGTDIGMTAVLPKVAYPALQPHFRQLLPA